MDLASQVKNVTEAIQAFPDLFTAIVALVANPAGIVVAVLFFLWLLVNFNYKGIFEALERKERRRLEQLNEYVALPDLGDPETIKAVKDLRDAHYFRVATGIHAEDKVRKAYIMVHKNLSHAVSWKLFCRAFEYIDVAADQNLTVRELTNFEKFGFWYNQFVGYLCMVLAAIVAANVFVSTDRSVTSFVLGFGGAGLVVLFAVYVFCQNWPVRAKERIEKELKGLQQRESDA